MYQLNFGIVQMRVVQCFPMSSWNGCLSFSAKLFALPLLSPMMKLTALGYGFEHSS